MGLLASRGRTVEHVLPLGKQALTEQAYRAVHLSVYAVEVEEGGRPADLASEPDLQEQEDEGRFMLRRWGRGGVGTAEGGQDQRAGPLLVGHDVRGHMRDARGHRADDRAGEVGLAAQCP